MHDILSDIIGILLRSISNVGFCGHCICHVNACCFCVHYIEVCLVLIWLVLQSFYEYHNSEIGLKWKNNCLECFLCNIWVIFSTLILIHFCLILLVWVLVTWKECTYCINRFICKWNVERHISKKRMLHNKLVYHPYQFFGIFAIYLVRGGVLFCPFLTRIVNSILHT